MAIANVKKTSLFFLILDEKGRETGRVSFLSGDSIVKFTSSVVIIRRKTSWITVHDEKGHEIAKGGDSLIGKY